MFVSDDGRLRSGRRKHITCEQFSGKWMRFLSSIFALSPRCPRGALPRKCSCHLESWLNGLFTPFHETWYQKFVVKNGVSSGVNEEWVQMISCVVGCAGNRLWSLGGACAPSQELVLVEWHYLNIWEAAREEVCQNFLVPTGKVTVLPLKTALKKCLKCQDSELAYSTVFLFKGSPNWHRT